jgi:Fe-S cluster assembly protein SufD
MSAVLDFPVKPEARDYLARFARDAGEPGWLAARRQQAMTRFAELGFPGRRNESWRYLDLQPLLREPLPPMSGAGAAVTEALRQQVAALSLAGAASRLVLIDGRCAPELSLVEPWAGVWVGSTARAVRERPDLVQATIGNSAGEAGHPFAALNAAFFADGFMLAVAPGIVLERPIQVIHLAAGAAAASLHTRSLIALGEDSRASVFETFAGDGRYWRNDVVVARLAPRASLARAVLVEEGEQAMHLARVDAELSGAAHFASFALLLGGQRVRQEAAVRIAGEGAHCRLDGAYIVTGSDEANIVTTVDHAAPGGQTAELIKGVAADRGHGAFQGCMIVRERAQKTDAHQLSRNLMIGRRAAIDTKPELEIYADDVKCSHGATIGDLDEAALFYLRARGVPPDEARRMLVEGFLRDAVEGIAEPALREHLLGRLADRLAGLEL